MQVNINTIFRRITFCLLPLIVIACNSGEKLPAISTGETVLILGDSLSYGTGAKQGEDYPTLLAKSTGWNIINAGIPGDTTAQGLARLPDLLTTHKPAVLMVELGGNDFLKKVAINETIANLKTIIKKGKSEGLSVVLIAIPDYQPVKAAFGGLDDHEIYATLAEEMNVPLIEDAFSTVLSDGALKADYVHPNEAGYQAVEKQLRKALAELGFWRDEKS